MNKTKLKAYAPQARKDFIAAVTARANQLGLTATKGELAVAPATRQGDVTLIEGREWPANVYTQRENLIKRMQREGFEQVVEAVAYTWFNRFAALRYMELHDYLGHGYRVLSSTAAGSGAHTPDILLHAVDLAQSQALPGLKADSVNQLKLAGNQDAELYRRLLIAQCNALSNAMPFLFERIDDETELLLPDNLLRTDSVIAKLVDEIPEEDWVQVEIVGWLYQFYISEKKDQVIGKVVKSEDIPAATQLFTPNWIVQYLVQNSVGRLWMMANPQSTLKSQWPYYIEPAEQSAEVNAQLDALIKTRMDEDGGSLNPETISVLDPACGSGHILVEAYELLKGIYLERGYRLRDIPRLILEKNLYGLDIDDRAAQMAGFALMMKARADDRRLLEEPIALNVLSLQESKGLPQEEIAVALAPYGVSAEVVKALIITFEHAKTFGSLIQIPESLNEQLPNLADALSKASKAGDLYAHQAANDLLPLVWQGLLLVRQYDAVIANPPYMGGKGMNSELKAYAKTTFPDSKSDLFAMFIERGFGWCKPCGFNSMVTMQSWMFLSSYEAMREKLLQDRTLSCMVHMGNGVMGIAFGTAATVLFRSHFSDYTAGFSYCENEDIGEHDKPKQFPVKNERLRSLGISVFKDLPGKPISYWINPSLRKLFDNSLSLESQYPPKTGMTTGDDGRFLRQWFEISEQMLAMKCSSPHVATASCKKWFPYNKGGVGTRWYGHCNFVVNWKNDGEELKKWVISNPNDPNTTSWSRRIFNHDFFFKPGLTWTLLNSRAFNVRSLPAGNILNVNGPTISIPDEDERNYVLGFLNSKVAGMLVQVINPTMANNPGDIGKLPLLFTNVEEIAKNSAGAVAICKSAWDEFEVSFDFQQAPIISWCRSGSLSNSYKKYLEVVSGRNSLLKELEECNNSIFIKAYGLLGEISPDVPYEQISLICPDRQENCQRLLSYTIGCMMGRYSLDAQGLIFAHAANEGFDPNRYSTYPADFDGIVPVTDELWFEDDAANRVREFLVAVWGADTLDENMTWLADSLGKKESESSEQTIRRYLADKFYKDHLQTYKKRPIYWLFSSGKQGAFQALVYLHRYHEGTLARMRAEYVVPLTGKIQARMDLLEKDAASAVSTSARNKINKEIEKLRKQHVELLAYDEKLRHYADMRISLDLDDGVKVNYGKFGDLLAEVKAVTGGTGDD